MDPRDLCPNAPNAPNSPVQAGGGKRLQCGSARVICVDDSAKCLNAPIAPNAPNSPV